MVSIKKLKKLALQIRCNTIKMVSKTKAAHLGGALSATDILVALYFSVLKINPKKPDMPERDRFIFSKGHAASVLYATLAERGFVSKDILQNYFVNNGVLTGHPTRGCLPGVEVSTGALGHGLSIGEGIAYAAKFDEKNYKTFVLMSDGECDGGPTWEAALSSGMMKLDNLVVIVDYNKIQSLGLTKNILDLEPFRKKWESFGWAVEEVDGHDFSKLLKTFGKLPLKKSKPSVIIAHTVKGKGIPNLENTVKSHYVAPPEEELEKILDNLK